MKTGIELIAQEREEQLTKHGRTVESDVENNTEEQLIEAAMLLLVGVENFTGPVKNFTPPGWDAEIFAKMNEKSEIERYVIAGALIAAEIDRLQTKTH